MLYLLCANYVLIFCELFQATQINLSERCLAGFLFLILRTHQAYHASLGCWEGRIWKIWFCLLTLIDRAKLMKMFPR